MRTIKAMVEHFRGLPGINKLFIAGAVMLLAAAALTGEDYWLLLILALSTILSYFREQAAVRL
ncbi:MAG: hypothetical protein HQL08_08660 [Nitrospirae bacterium]|nr:hypothetical protein [Nitrospirota bacterium]